MGTYRRAVGALAEAHWREGGKPTAYVCEFLHPRLSHPVWSERWEVGCVRLPHLEEAR